MQQRHEVGATAGPGDAQPVPYGPSGGLGMPGHLFTALDMPLDIGIRFHIACNTRGGADQVPRREQMQAKERDGDRSATSRVTSHESW